MKRLGLTQPSPLRRSAAIGLVVALGALGAGGYLAVNQQRRWTAEADLVVLPGAGLNSADSAAFYETLSRGQIVATFAEVLGDVRFKIEAQRALGLTNAQRKDLSVSVGVVPNTSVILVRATASTSTVAEEVTDTTASLASRYLESNSAPYVTKTVRTARDTAYRAGTSAAVLLLGAFIVALVLGLAVQQAAYHVQTAVRRSPDALYEPPPVRTPDVSAPPRRRSPAVVPARGVRRSRPGFVGAVNNAPPGGRR